MDNTQGILLKAVREIGIFPTDSQIDLLLRYSRELLAWNEKMSLVSLKSSLDIIKHLVDSLTPACFVTADSLNLLDIGTGAGLPGIPLKIINPSLRVTLVEASRKKTSFLKSVIRTLGLQDIQVVNSRIESLVSDTSYKGCFDIVISRATFKIHDLLTLGMPFMAEGGTVIAMKGRSVNDEMVQGMDAIRKTELTLAERRNITLPLTGEYRTLLCFTRGLS